jgi:hypothetical protein
MAHTVGVSFLFTSPAAYQKKRVIVSNTGEGGGDWCQLKAEGSLLQTIPATFFVFFHDSFVVILFFYFCTDKMAMRETFCSIRQTNWSGFNTVLGTHTRIIYYSIEKIDKFTLG